MFHGTLRRKFLLYCSPVLVCVFILGVYCLLTFSTIHNQFAGIQKDLTPNALAMLEVKKLLLSLETGLKNKNIKRQEISHYLTRLREIVASHPNHKETDPRSQASHEMVHHTIRTLSLSEYVLTQSQSDWQDRDLEITLALIHQEVTDLEPVLDAHLKIHLEELTKTETFVSKKYQQSLLVIAGVGIIIVVLTAWMLMSMIRTVLGPVSRLQEGVRQIGAGNLGYALDIKSRDEFEFLGQEFQKMAKELGQFHKQLDRQVQERTKELVTANSELHKAERHVHQLSRQLLSVQESERQSIALDLHDNVAQELSALKVSGKLIRQTISAGQFPDGKELQEWELVLDRAIKTVRELAYNLRPPGLEQLGLVVTLSDFCRNFAQETGVDVAFSHVGCENLQLDFQHAITMYRLVQEAFNNIQKHAQASKVAMKLLRSYPHIILRIRDNGLGFDLQEGYQRAREEKRLGLLGMRERVNMIGGTIDLQSERGHGTKIVIQIPWDETYDRKDESTPD